MIPFLAAIAVMAGLVVVHDPPKKDLAACADTVYVIVYRRVIDGPFPMAVDDSVQVYGERP